jgi:hypothetical protein
LPIGLPVDIELGEAMDIAIEPKKLRDHTSGSGATTNETMDIEVKLTNNKPIAVTLELLQRKDEAADFRIASESKRHTLKYGMPLWTFNLGPGEQRTLHYTMEHAKARY